MSFVINSAAYTQPRDEPGKTRKRTREDRDAEGGIDRRPISIRVSTQFAAGQEVKELRSPKHDSSDPFAKPRTFTPISLLSRSRLPLAWLDTAHDGSRMFTAHIQSLEAGDEDNVLIVEDQSGARRYAVERVQRRRYALCRLGEGVKVEDLVSRGSEYASKEQVQRKRRALEGVEGGKPWWDAAGVGIPEENLAVTKDGMPTLSMFKKEAKTAPAKTEATGDVFLVDAAGLQDDPISVLAHPTAQDPLEELVKAYLDALYLSRTPVAYFVKGPLARARAAFASEPSELISFLRTSILSDKTTDKKYRENVPEFVKDLPPRDTPKTKPKSKKKRKWKPRRDKYGFFADEKDYVEQWWRGDDEQRTTLDSAEKLEVMIRRRSQGLRSRETFLQVVLILETIALEASAVKASDALAIAVESQNTEPQAGDTQAGRDAKKFKKKKEVDVSALLDNLLDYLVIWYSLASGPPAKSTDSVEGKGEASDDLRGFASEVIIPFFSARIHERANAASKKLGGPTQPHPSKSKAFAPRKPGEPAVRQPPTKQPRKPLERVPSDALNKVGKRPLSLHRAATGSDALSNMIKREMSETPPMESVPMSKRRSRQTAAPGLRKRPSLLESLARREVDLSAMSQATEAKLKRKMEAEEKVRDAIDAVRKPNRTKAVEEHAKDTDESFAKAIAKSKGYGGQRKTADKNATAITATPRHIKATPARHKHIYQGPSHTHSTGSTSVVPGTSARQLAVPGQISNSTFAVLQTGHRPRQGASLIDDTPSRGFAKFLPPALSRTPGTLLESPTATRRPQIMSTPARVSKMPSLVQTPLTKVPASSLKGRTYSPGQVVAGLSPAKEDSGIGGLAGDTALYNALGWDDDEYEELP